VDNLDIVLLAVGNGYFRLGAWLHPNTSQAQFVGILDHLFRDNRRYYQVDHVRDLRQLSQ
jgi:hypothetical protein